MASGVSGMVSGVSAMASGVSGMASSVSGMVSDVSGMVNGVMWSTLLQLEDVFRTVTGFVSVTIITAT